MWHVSLCLCLLLYFPNVHCPQRNRRVLASSLSSLQHSSQSQVVISRTWSGGVKKIKNKNAADEDAGVCFIGLFAFALLSLTLWFTASHHICEGMEGWRRAASDDSAPRRASKMSLIISIYPPQTFANLAEPSSSPKPPAAQELSEPHPLSAASHCV